MVIFVVLLILFSNIAFAKDVVILETFEKDVVLEDGSGETTYFYAGSKLVASKNDDIVKYHYQDRLGSDVDSKSLPFGQLLKEGERFSFTGKELDSDLYYFNARYYDSNLGRFTSVDPVPSEPAYQYVGNNPIMFVDPTGTVFDEPLGQREKDQRILDRATVSSIPKGEVGMPYPPILLGYNNEGEGLIPGSKDYSRAVAFYSTGYIGLSNEDVEGAFSNTMATTFLLIGASQAYVAHGLKGVVGEVVAEGTGLPLNPIEIRGSMGRIFKYFQKNPSRNKNMIRVIFELDGSTPNERKFDLALIKQEGIGPDRRLIPYDLEVPLDRNLVVLEVPIDQVRHLKRDVLIPGGSGDIFNLNGGMTTKGRLPWIESKDFEIIYDPSKNNVVNLLDHR
ncbi:MAG: hypothetical protein HN374_00065 [Cryomorphaceae bacterium]|nr:hypothetical protein [Cryomorphaceae bacterium]